MYIYGTLKFGEFIEFESSKFREFGRVARIGVPEGEKKKKKNTCAYAEMKNEADAEIRYRNEYAAPLGATCF